MIGGAEGRPSTRHRNVMPLAWICCPSCGLRRLPPAVLFFWKVVTRQQYCQQSYRQWCDEKCRHLSGAAL